MPFWYNRLMTLTKKIWFIDIEGEQEGPFSYLELEKDARLTPNTLVWKEGFEKWLPISKVSELKGLFHDDDETTQEFEPKPLASEDEIALEYQKDPRTYLWVLLLLLAASYILYQLFAD